MQAETINTFKNRLDKHWSNQDVLFNFPADITGIGSLLICRSSFGRRAFSVAGPMVWNSLPDFLRDTSLSKDTFRRSLKTYFFALY